MWFRALIAMESPAQRKGSRMGPSHWQMYANVDANFEAVTSSTCETDDELEDICRSLYSNNLQENYFVFGYDIDCWLYPVDKPLKSKLICKTPIGVFVEDLLSWKSFSVKNEEGFSHAMFEHTCFSDTETPMVLDESILETTRTYLLKYFNDVKISKEINEIYETGNVLKFEQIQNDIYKIMASATFILYRQDVWYPLGDLKKVKIRVVCVFVEMIIRTSRLKIVSEKFHSQIKFVGTSLMFYEDKDDESKVGTSGILLKKCSLFDASPTVKLLHAYGLTKEKYRVQYKPTKSQISKFLAFEFDDEDTAQCFVQKMFCLGTTYSQMKLIDAPLTLKDYF